MDEKNKYDHQTTKLITCFENEHKTNSYKEEFVFLLKKKLIYKYISRNFSRKMKNKNYRVVVLVSACFSVYLTLSILALKYDWKWEPFDKINLVADILKKKEPKKDIKDNDNKKSEKVVDIKASQDFELYKIPEHITNFYKAENTTALPKIAQKLTTLKKTGKGKIRIAYFGDSMIEGDLMTQTFRSLLQKEFGGYGVGFLPMHSKVGSFRQTASVSGSGWTDTSFKTKGAQNMYISGHRFSGMGNGTYKDNTILPEHHTQKVLLYGKTNKAIVEINGSELVISGEQSVNRKIIANDQNNLLKLKSKTPALPIYGISFESENGVFVDNFSFRGITGIELAKISTDFLKSVQQANPYDLIVLQYGVNLLFRAKDTDYSYYEKIFTPVIKNIKEAFPDADVLLIGAADRAFRYDGTYKTAIGLPNLVRLQAQIAFDNKLAFYNQFETMGGENAIVRWATQKPALANKDYIHPNAKGTEVLAQKLFQAFMKDYQKHQTLSKGK